MSNQITATVEVLTAEVRVLMVGSRQITLSVARQLDEVEWEQCEPFGRIRDSQDFSTAVIGRDRNNGQLCKTHIHDSELRSLKVTLSIKRSGPGKPRYWKGDGQYYTEAEGEAMEQRRDELQNQYNELKAEYDALPLIVLAGLR
jgi:hypothetical protein